MAFAELLEVLNMMMNFAPVFLLLMFIILIGKLIDIVMRPGILIFLTVGITLMLMCPVVSSEPIEDYYTDKKQFSYMNICRTYVSYNYTNWVSPLSGAGDGELFLNTSQEGIKPTKTLLWQNNTRTTLNLLTKMVYNYTQNDKFNINLYYASNNSDSLRLKIVYYDYWDDNRPNNVSRNYTVLEGGKNDWEKLDLYSQSAQQRFSNINHTRCNFTALGNTYHNAYEFYEKRKNTTTTETVINVSRTVVKDYITINTNEWVNLLIQPKTLIYDDIVYKSYKFMNIGIVKDNLSDVVVIDDIDVIRVKNPETILHTPCLEYFEFRRIDDNASRTILHIEFISNEYQEMYIHSLSVGLDSDGILYYHVLGPDYNYNSSLVYYLDDSVNDESFVGYQINVLYDVTINSYSVKIYYKYAENIRDAWGQVTYYYSSATIIYNQLTYQFAHILDIEYYDNLQESDGKLYHTANSNKFDIKDVSFTRIDIDNKGDIVLTKNIDSSGFRIPSLNDLKKMIFDVIKPLFNIVLQLQETLLSPIMGILNQIISLEVIVNGISNLITGIGNTVTSIDGLVSSIESIISAIQGIINTISTNLNNVKSLITSILSTLSNIYTIVSDTWTQLEDIILWLGGIIAGSIAYLQSISGTIISFLSNVTGMILTFWELTFSILGTIFSYFIVFKILRFSETEDLNDLWGILEAFGMIAEFVLNAFRAILSMF